MRISHDALCGQTVVSSDGLAVGEIETLLIDSDTWRVDSLQVKLRKDIADRLGADRSVFHAAVLDLPLWMVQSVKDAVVLSIPVDRLRQVLPGASAAAPTQVPR